MHGDVGVTPALAANATRSSSSIQVTQIDLELIPDSDDAVVAAIDW